MAFGFGFNKQKALSAAEKFVQQGKLQNAIAEYEKVLKADPKELTVSILLATSTRVSVRRQGRRIASRALATPMPRKASPSKPSPCTRSSPSCKPTLESVLRLAELYTQQGLFQ